MKRKANYLDEDCGVQIWNSRSPLSESSVCSHDSLDQHSTRPIPWSLHPRHESKTISATNLRTRKRHRDNRPDVDVVHQTTLAKLYNAQKREQTVPENSSELATRSVNSLGQPGPAQRNLHSFFNIRQPQPAMISSIQFQLQSTQSQPELCAGCGNYLRHSNAIQSLDHDAMEMDQSLMCLEDEYECASCQRSVCDTCAVRGDQRICLECALPGTG